MPKRDPPQVRDQHATSRADTGSQMPRPHVPASPRWLWIHSRRLHIVLYSFLLVATPFILLQNFLVEFIGFVSGLRTTVAGVSVPILPTAAGVVFLLLLIVLRRRIRRRHVIAVLIVMLMDAAVQQVSDYYFDHNFYDLQQNWHYIAYGLFAYMLYRDLSPRGYRLSRIMLLTGGCALAFSTFDESFQMHMSDRIFDVGDISKDLWGSLMGMVLIYGGGSRAHELWSGVRRLRLLRLRDYVNESIPVLAWMVIFGFLFVSVSGLFTEVEYLATALAATVGTFAVLFLLVHLTQFRRPRYVLAFLLVAAIGAQAYSAYRFRHAGVSYVSPNMTSYNGMPLPLFDYLFFADGTFRPVDKKHLFNNRDQRKLLSFCPDILILGAGYQGRGGNGLPDRTPCQFIFNRFTHRGTQVFILSTPQACEAYNRLRLEHRNVLFVLHSGC
jgi:hypothetical protein